MSFEFSFAPEFFYGEMADETPGSERPCSVWGALNSLKESKVKKIVEELGGVYMPYAEANRNLIFDQIMKTNTVTDLRSPVEVWIDPQGYRTVWVYDEERP